MVHAQGDGKMVQMKRTSENAPGRPENRRLTVPGIWSVALAVTMMLAASLGCSGKKRDFGRAVDTSFEANEPGQGPGSVGGGDASSSPSSNVADPQGMANAQL